MTVEIALRAGIIMRAMQRALAATPPRSPQHHILAKAVHDAEMIFERFSKAAMPDCVETAQADATAAMLANNLKTRKG